MASELDVAYVAQLARLQLTEEETALFQKQLGDVLKYAEKLKEVNVEGVEAAAHAVPIFNVFRADEPCDWFTADRSPEQRTAAGQQSFHRHQSCGMTKRDLPALSIVELQAFSPAKGNFAR